MSKKPAVTEQNTDVVQEEEDKPNKGYSFIVGIVIVIAIMILFVFLFPN